MAAARGRIIAKRKGVLGPKAVMLNPSSAELNIPAIKDELLIRESPNPRDSRGTRSVISALERPPKQLYNESREDAKQKPASPCFWLMRNNPANPSRLRPSRSGFRPIESESQPRSRGKANATRLAIPVVREISLAVKLRRVITSVIPSLPPLMENQPRMAANTTKK
jgi:hypothetical protein